MSVLHQAVEEQQRTRRVNPLRQQQVDLLKESGCLVFQQSFAAAQQYHAVGRGDQVFRAVFDDDNGTCSSRFSRPRTSKVCRRCEALDDRMVALGQPFYEDTFGGGLPPRHPNCRCAVAPVTLEQVKQLPRIIH